MTPNERIAAERARQISKEGWSREHDATHDGNEMYDAAIVYLTFDADTPLRADGTPDGWPWEAAWFKPKDRLRNLERAGALFIAERERREGAGLPLGDIEERINEVVKAIEAIAA